MADTPNNSDAEGKFCPECKGTGIITDYKHGERICVECGFVLEEKMLTTARNGESFKATAEILISVNSGQETPWKNQG
ncbi:MAG: hypothetical protein COZ91_02600 [Candidatus Nealsonbacteria bacterium CG_4_8_14_3_um_filter_39_7]|nr:MAG: hypothetical protein COZ91_02600 [Candidatus Nealsonbacteria bacterium CG_4_8_14_3_um_filter_39_7]